jgi:hypothetical protein
MFRKPLAVGFLVLTAIAFTTCATDPKPDPEPMPTYANPWIGSAGSNTPAPQPATKTPPPKKTPPPPPPPQQAAAPATTPSSRAPIVMQPSASAPMQAR